MSSAAPALPLPAYSSLRLPAAAFELLFYLAAVAVATLFFLAGWLPVNGAVILTVVLLATLIVMSWVNLGHGRHPVFLFLCTLTLFQGGRLLAYCLGADAEPLKVALMGVDPFTLARNEEGLVLLCIVLSGICVYAPCRWNYRHIPPPDGQLARPYLPYLYLVFFASLPAQLFKNYSYFTYAQQHGGYSSIYTDYSGLAASAPFLVRLISLITLPAFLAIFVVEQRRKLIALVTVLYFGSALLTLLMGSRLALFSLVLALWYVAKVKSTKKTRIVAFVALALTLTVVGDVIANLRDDPDQKGTYEFLPLKFLELEGVSLDVTQVAIKYSKLFAPHMESYLFNGLQTAFVANDIRHYARGKSLDYDVSVFMNPVLFSSGFGVGGSYVADAYLIGGISGVVVISLLIGGGLHVLRHLSGNSLHLIAVVMVLPSVLWMPRGQLLDWASFLARNAIFILVLACGWHLFRLFTSIRHMPAGLDVSRPTNGAS